MKRIFYITYKIADSVLLIRKSQAFEKWGELCGFILFILSGLIAFVSNNIPYFLLVICFFIQVIDNAPKCLLSISGFLTSGIWYWFVFTVLLIIIFEWFGGGVFSVYLISTITWCFYSLIANNKVSSMVNQIVSAVFAVIVLLKDMILSLVPDEVLNKTFTDEYTMGRGLEAVFNLICTPILITNLIAMTLCLLKGYWIEKYNNNQDTGQKGINVEEEIETIKENNKQLYKRLDELTERVAQLEKKLEGKN